MASYPHRLSQIVTKMNEPVVIKGKVIRTNITKRIKRPGFRNNPDYEAWSVILGDPEIIKGADTQLGKALANVDDTSKSFKTSTQEGSKTVFFLESRSKFGLPLIDGKTNQQVTDADGNVLTADQALKGELSSDMTIEVAVEMVPTSQGNPTMATDAICVPDIKNVKYYEGGANRDFGSLFGSPKGAAPVAKANKPAASEEPAADKPTADNDSDDESIDDTVANLFGDDED